MTNLEKLQRCAYTFGTQFPEGEINPEYAEGLKLLNEVIKDHSETKEAA